MCAHAHNIHPIKYDWSDFPNCFQHRWPFNDDAVDDVVTEKPNKIYLIDFYRNPLAAIFSKKFGDHIDNRRHLGNP
jgi:hypothetical protein